MAPNKALSYRDIFCMRMSTQENLTNTPEMIELVRAQCLDKEEEAIRLNGEFTAKGGYVYKEYRDRAPYIVEPFHIPEAQGLLLNSIDPHASTPHGVAWCWIDYDGDVEVKTLTGGDWKTPLLTDDKPNIFTCAELFQEGTIEELSDSIKLMEAKIGRESDMRLCDPAAWNEDQGDKETKTTASILEEYGLYVTKGSKDMTGGNRKVRIELLLRDGQDYPRLMLFAYLRRLRHEMVNYRYPNLRGRTADEKKRPDKPIDKDDHVIECQRRMIEAIVDGKVEIQELDKHELLAPDGRVLDVELPRPNIDNEDEEYEDAIMS